MKFTHLKKEYVVDVANIVTEKYKESRKKMPLLSPKYENLDMHIKHISKYVDNEAFIVGIDQDKIVGFMYGIPIDEFKGTAKGALVLPAIHGVIKGYDHNKFYNEMYGYISDVWANNGCYTHCVLMYANEFDALDTWFYNGFGLFVIDAVRNLNKIDIPNISDDISIRKATIKDLPDMLPLFKGINNHLESAPIFLLRDQADYVKQYTKWLNRDEHNLLWIASKDNQIIGFLKTNIHETNQDELNDGETLGINGAYVKPEYRGNYIMSRLINKALDWAKEMNLKRCSTDFETANPEGRRYWLKHFKPYSYALIRRIDERNHLNKKR